MRAGQRQAEQAAAPAAAQAAAPDTTDNAAQYRNWQISTHQALTDEEFAAMKKKILGS
jgi:hypothetical protein